MDEHAVRQANRNARQRRDWTPTLSAIVGVLSAGLMLACASGSNEAFVPEFVPLPQKVCRAEGDCDQGRRCYKRFPGVYGYCVPAEYYATHPRGCEADTDCHAREVCDPVPGRILGVCIPRFRSAGDEPPNRPGEP